MTDFRRSSVPPGCYCCVVFVEDPCTGSATFAEALQYQHDRDDLSLDCNHQLCQSIVLQLMYACGSSHFPVIVPGNKQYMFVLAADRDSSNVVAKGASSKASLGLPSDASEGVVLTPKNVHALRTLFNIAHRLHHLLGPAWVLVLDILNTLDRILQSPRTTTQVTFLEALQPLCCLRCAANAVLLMLCTSQAAWLAATCLIVTDAETDQQLGQVL